MRSMLAPRRFESIEGARAPIATDREALADLMLDAYRGTIDYEGESREDAITEVDRTLAGGYGEFLGAFSRVVEREQQLASACLFTLHEGHPWLSVSMTRPRWKRHGFARGLLDECLNQLAEARYQEIGLLVTEGNSAAEGLYRSLGFEPAPS
jgi:ribosomal protein S18 acetylase RimI-like enzyme